MVESGDGGWVGLCERHARRGISSGPAAASPGRKRGELGAAAARHSEAVDVRGLVQDPCPRVLRVVVPPVLSRLGLAVVFGEAPVNELCGLGQRLDGRERRSGA